MITFVGNRPVWTPASDLPSLATAKLIAVDVETRDDGIQAGTGPGGVAGKGHLCGISIATDDGFSAYFPIRHPDSHVHLWPIAAIRRWAKTELTRSNQTKVGANILYDLEWLRASRVPIEGPYADVQHMEALLNEQRGVYNLESLSEQYLCKRFHKASGYLEKMVAERFGPHPEKAAAYIWKLSAEEIGPYAELDAIGTLKIYKMQLIRLKREELMRVFDMECRLLPMLLAMRFRGVRVNINRLEETIAKVDELIKVSYDTLNHIAGKRIDNINSAVQIAAAFDAAGITYPRTPKTKAPSFQKEWLEYHPSDLAGLVLRTRRLERIKNATLEGAIKTYLIGDRIYPRFHPAKSGENGTVTGRLSCSNPNAQQFPSREDVGAELVRSLFIPEDSEEWWKADSSQIEYRFLVHYSEWLGLTGADRAAEAYRIDLNTDFHQWVATICNIDRKRAKSINFGLVYGMGKGKLSRSLGLDRRQTDATFDVYHREVPFVNELSASCGRKARTAGYIATIFGRRRRFDRYEPIDNQNMSKEERDPALPFDEAVEAYQKKNRAIHRAWTYRAINSLLQGSAADHLKKAMVDLWESGVCNVLGVPSLTIHDELDGSKPRTLEAGEALREGKRIMESAIPLKVPVLVEVATGENWWELNAIN